MWKGLGREALLNTCFSVSSPPTGQHAEEAQGVRGVSQQGLHPGCVPPTWLPGAAAQPFPHALQVWDTHACSHLCSAPTHTCTLRCIVYAGMYAPMNTHTHTQCLPSIHPCFACLSLYHQRHSLHVGPFGAVLSVFPDLFGFSSKGVLVCPPLFSSWDLRDTSATFPLTIGSVTRFSPADFQRFEVALTYTTTTYHSGPAFPVGLLAVMQVFRIRVEHLRILILCHFNQWEYESVCV